MAQITRVPLARVRVEELARPSGRLTLAPAPLVTLATTASFKPAINGQIQSRLELRRILLLV